MRITVDSVEDEGLDIDNREQVDIGFCYGRVSVDILLAISTTAGHQVLLRTHLGEQP
jgi:hypothetical protein